MVPQERQTGNIATDELSRSRPRSASAENLQFIFCLTRHSQALALPWVLLATVGEVTERQKVLLSHAAVP